MTHPMIIQGGMGIGVSGWRLASAVSQTGQLGVVSGTALDQLFARKLQLGDPGGHLRRALAAFPDADMARRILDKYFIEGGKPNGKPFKAAPALVLDAGDTLRELTVCASFSEVYLAKEGHGRPVGINLMEKIQLPNLFAIYGAMLAGVDYVIMGAGIPKEIPGVLDRLSCREEASIKVFVEGAERDDDFRIHLDPATFMQNAPSRLKRPDFYSIVSSDALATMMKRKANGAVNGFIIESCVAGGHNAPPRGKLLIDDNGEPVYGARDEADLDKIRELGLPFWLAGSQCSPEKLEQALSLGAKGVQVGTAFAFSVESGFSDRIKDLAKSGILKGLAKVFTDPHASPTGFPFKVLSMKDSLSAAEEYLKRKRICDLGYLRQLYKKIDGAIGYRCSAEPEEAYVKKGGDPEKTEGKKCLCNALLANIGLGQFRRDGYVEKELVTSGNDILPVLRMWREKASYTAADVIDWLLSGVSASHAAPPSA